MRYAKAALLTGLLKLDPGDRFGLVAFDHDQQWWTGELLGLCASAPAVLAMQPHASST